MEDTNSWKTVQEEASEYASNRYAYYSNAWNAAKQGFIAAAEKYVPTKLTSKPTDQDLTDAAQKIIHSIVGDPPDSEDFPNEYEFACEMYNRVSEWTTVLHSLAARISELAEDEYCNRSRDLTQYELKPGIPLPQYRTHLSMPDPEGTTRIDEIRRRLHGG